jgi:hypothetical protein
MSNTRKYKSKKAKGSATRGWNKLSPNQRERNSMLLRCGHKCFLGKGTSFPICTHNSCNINRKGVQSAYNRARQYKHYSVAKKASKLLKYL